MTLERKIILRLFSNSNSNFFAHSNLFYSQGMEFSSVFIGWLVVEFVPMWDLGLRKEVSSVEVFLSVFIDVLENRIVQ